MVDEHGKSAVWDDKVRTDWIVIDLLIELVKQGITVVMATHAPLHASREDRTMQLLDGPASRALNGLLMTFSRVRRDPDVGDGIPRHEGKLC